MRDRLDWDRDRVRCANSQTREMWTLSGVGLGIGAPHTGSRTPRAGAGGKRARTMGRRHGSCAVWGHESPRFPVLVASPITRGKFPTDVFLVLVTTTNEQLRGLPRYRSAALHR